MRQHSSDLVSVIIPVYNRPHMLLDAVNSVLEQSHTNFEIIIVDDGSTDSTPDVIENLIASDSRIVSLRLQNGGPGLAREAGRLSAKGHFIQYLDSDDLLLPTKFENQIQALNNAPEAGACYCITDIEITHSDQRPKQRIRAWKKTGERIESILPSMLAERWWGTSTALYRKEICDLAGPWKDWINEEDWEYDCRIALKNNRLCYVPKTLSIERQHGESRLSNNGSTDPNKLIARASAHIAVIEHALNSSYDTDTTEFVTLLKASFLLCRQCGAAGLVNESKALFIISEQHLSNANINTKQLKLYRLATRLIGWQASAKLALFTDRFRP